MITKADIPRLSAQAHAKMIEAGADQGSEDDFWAWAETLPEDEAIAMLVTMMAMQDELDTDKAKRGAQNDAKNQ